MTKYCSSCCLNCQQAGTSEPLVVVPDTPFALGNLLQAGTVNLTVAPDIRQAICAHHHAEDGWHEFNPAALISRLSDSQYTDLCHELAFLAAQRFLTATYRLFDDGQLILRIYLIPYDLVNVQGKLRVRKDSILNPAKRYMRNLLPKILQDIDTWNGLPLPINAKELVPDILDSRTLSEIYSDLRSPIVSPTDGLGNIAARLLDFQDNLEGLGMRSTLYPYQRRSVAAMLQKELDPRDVPDPLYISVSTMDGKDFYLQPGTMEILLQRPMTAPCKGGILCEELGTGKTVMMLSLIVATKDKISLPEQSIVDERPIMTPLAFRHFPSGDFSSARKRFHRRSDPLEKHNLGSRVPTLVELLIHQYRVFPHCEIPRNISDRHYVRMMEMKDGVDTLPLGDILRANAPFYLHYPGEPRDRERAKRKKAEQSPRLMYLTSATLIVVPPNLLSQWDREITKHCAVPLRVFMARSKTPLPCVRSLASDYDIVLMTYTRFTTESSLHDSTKLHTWNPCPCPEFPGYRVPNCSCQISGISPLLQIRWKRLVIDEGHVSANLATTLVPFARMLSVESRWIITGTPTTNLLGLSLGSKDTESWLSSPIKTNGRAPNHGQPEEEENIGMDESNPSSLEATPAGTPSPTIPSKRIWTKYDREDLNKLGNMITHFIAVPQFYADCTLISTHVVEPLLDPCGPRRGAIQVLNQLMELVMIRHRIEDVEKAIILPPVSHESVLLDLDPYVVKSFNALQAAIVVNAIDSQRTDQDYLFHARNMEHLQATVKNMSQLLFWHVDSGLFNAEELVKSSEAHIQRAIDRNMPEEDIRLLKEAFYHLRLAAEDRTWRAIQNHEDIPYRVFNMAESVFNIWTRTPGNEANSHPNQTGLLHADRLLKLYDMVIQRPLIQENAMIEWGCAVVKRDEAFRKAYDESLLRKHRTRKRGRNHVEDYTSGSMMADNFTRKASAANTLKEMQRELDATLARLSREEDMDDEDRAQRPEVVAAPPSLFRGVSALVASSPLASMRLGSSASTKLNYIINEVHKYAPTEKFLVFSESPLTLAHVAEALELIHVKFLRFTTQITPQIREQLVLTFETSETYRVFLMELKHGARGLNLISASRIIFCEPVWQADVESQAIKRAHRIGQTREITVKTLAIRHSAEERIVARRAALKNSHEKLPKLIEEAGMRHYIANPKFITHIPSFISTLDFPFLDPPEPLVLQNVPVILKIPPLSSPLKRVRVEGPVLEQSEVEHSPKKKKTIIRFVM